MLVNSRIKCIITHYVNFWSKMANYFPLFEKLLKHHVLSLWNFYRSFWRLIQVKWHHLQVNQEPPCPPRLQEGTWRTGRVLTGFLMLDLDEIFTATSEGWYMSYDTISRFIRNLHVVQHSRKRLGGQIESWQASWCWIWMKFSHQLHRIDTCHMTHSNFRGWYISYDTISRFVRNLHVLKTPGRDLEDW